MHVNGTIKRQKNQLMRMYTHVMNIEIQKWNTVGLAALAGGGGVGVGVDGEAALISDNTIGSNWPSA